MSDPLEDDRLLFVVFDCRSVRHARSLSMSLGQYPTVDPSRVQVGGRSHLGRGQYSSEDD